MLELSIIQIITHIEAVTAAAAVQKLLCIISKEALSKWDKTKDVKDNLTGLDEDTVSSGYGRQYWSKGQLKSTLQIFWVFLTLMMGMGIVIL